MSTLQITYDELRREVGRFIAGVRDPDDFSTDNTTDVGDIIRSGMRSFYWPNVGEERYAWSFLRKVGSLDTVAAQRTYTLPDDFGGVLLGMTYANGQNKFSLSRVGEEEIRGLYGAADRGGLPSYCALRAVQPGQGKKTDYEVLLYPVPNAVYTLSFRYAIEPDELSVSNSLHLGGAVHSECVLEACLAAAEKTLRPELGPGVHTEKFLACLQASIKIDGEMQ